MMVSIASITCYHTETLPSSLVDQAITSVDSFDRLLLVLYLLHLSHDGPHLSHSRHLHPLSSQFASFVILPQLRGPRLGLLKL